MVLDGSLPVRGSDRRGDNPALRGLPVVAHLSGRCEAGTTVLRFELGEGSPPRGGAEGPFCCGAAEREAEDRRPRFATAPHNPTRGNRSNPRCRGTAGRPLLDDPPLPRCVTSDRSAKRRTVVPASQRPPTTRREATVQILGVEGQRAAPFSTTLPFPVVSHQIGARSGGPSSPLRNGPPQPDARQPFKS